MNTCERTARDVMKKGLTIIISMIALVLVITTVFFIKNGEVSAVNPLDTGKEILYYLFWTDDDQLKADTVALQNKLGLTDEQMEALKELGLKEHLVCQNLSEVYADDASSFNAALDENTQASKQRIQEILGDRTEDFRNWIAAWWEEERQDRMNSDA